MRPFWVQLFSGPGKNWSSWPQAVSWSVMSANTPIWMKPAMSGLSTMPMSGSSPDSAPMVYCLSRSSRAT